MAERFSRKYRIMWNQNGGEEASYHPSMTPEKYAQAFLGFLEGTPVDAFVSGLGWASGYQVIYPTEVEGMASPPAFPTPSTAPNAWGWTFAHGWARGSSTS